MIKLNFEKLYAVDRINEPCYVGVPLKKGIAFDINKIAVKNSSKNTVPYQLLATGYWDDGSIKWLFARFFADIKANKSAEYFVDINSESFYNFKNGINFKNNVIDNGRLEIKLSEDKNKIFEYILYNKKYNIDISYPHLEDKKGNKYDFKADKWEIEEIGNLCLILKCKGNYILNNQNIYENELTLTIYLNKPYFELAPRIINTTDDALEIKSYSIKASKALKGVSKHTAAHSNYKTKFITGDEARIYVDAKFLKNEPNEHFAEVFYGTFFGDYTDDEMGICATIYQAQQNFPKAVNVNKEGIEVMLVPEISDGVKMESGMAREQKIDFLFHCPNMDIYDINNHSIIYQMPDRPLLEPEIFKKSEVFTDVFVNNKNYDVENFIIGKADEHARCYGMMNWGDAADTVYTEQGRGGGKLVWTNNEYDFPHACTLQFIRTGVRRYLDYNIAACSHWIDVDVCHYSDNPLIYGGQYEHTNSHTVNGKIVCSHQWVEGLLDCYHFTGNKAAYNTAIGIGNNILKILETPKFNQPGDMSARETGWALRSLSALYTETNDEKWLEKCDWIVGHFEQWENKYGLWLSAYTDNTLIRVVFMIGVAVGSLMRYYRIRPDEKIKNMILRAVDDLCDNAMLECGLFYYKELPSLQRLSINPTVLEALAIAYELTGNKKYIVKGIPTLKHIMANSAPKISMSKNIIEDTVMVGNVGTKSFAQMMIPVAAFYKAASDEGLL